MLADDSTYTKLTCPECSATVLTDQPEVLVWEYCPGCGQHVWDMTDVLLGETSCCKAVRAADGCGEISRLNGGNA
jgi:hypothetical protein